MSKHIQMCKSFDMTHFDEPYEIAADVIEFARGPLWEGDSKRRRNEHAPRG